MDRLRGPGGCPWDHEQTYGSLRRYLIEECYEVADAIDRSDLAALREELGDLLLQVVFLSRIAKEEGAFAVDDVAHGISDKLVRRHPHVFGEGSAKTAEEVSLRWDEIKRREKTERGHAHRSRLDGVPPSLPAVASALQLGDRAAAVGFDWPGPSEVIEKLEEEFDELKRALESGNDDAVTEEVGDFLFSTVMLARKANVDPEAALARTNRKFRRRFAWIERALADEGTDPEDAGLERLDRLWDAAKKAETE